MTPTPLDERVVAVTGAGRGLGLLTARVLLEQGAQVIANHRSFSEDLEQLGKEFPDRLHPVQGDIGEEEAARELARAGRALGRIDALVCNAGITRDRLLVQMPVEEWEEVQRVNLRGAFLASKHTLKLMMRQRYGRIVYVSSIVAYQGNIGQSAYAAAKAGLEGLARSVAQEYTAYNVRTAVVAPGLLDTGLATDLAPQWRQTVAERSLADCAGAGAQAARTIAYLSSSAADFINATVVHVDGGVKYP